MDETTTPRLCTSAGCSENAITLSQHCWQHTQDKDGYKDKILEFILKFKEKHLFLRKVNLDHTNLQDLDLKFADLSQASFINANLHSANLRGANLFGANLSGSDLSYADLNESDLTRANLNNARLWYTNLKDCRLSEANLNSTDLWQANMHNTRLWNTEFTSAKHLSKDAFRNKKGGLFGLYKVYEGNFLIAKEAYRELKRYFTSAGRYDDASWASFREKTMETKAMMQNKDIRFLPSLMMGFLCGYGEKSRRVILASFVILLIYAAAYQLLGALMSKVIAGELVTFGECLYFSVVTFTTLGLGDFIPKSNVLFRILAGSEAFLGAFMIGLFVFTLARKYSAR